MKNYIKLNINIIPSNKLKGELNVMLLSYEGIEMS